MRGHIGRECEARLPSSFKENQLTWGNNAVTFFKNLRGGVHAIGR
jgi:hypothetical protein